MPIDVAGRQRLLQEKQMQSLKDSILSMGEKISNGLKSPEEYRSLNLKLKQEADPLLVSLIKEMNKALATVYTAIKGIRVNVEIPKLQKVEFDRVPPVTVSNLSEITRELNKLKPNGMMDIKSIPPVKISNLNELFAEFNRMYDPIIALLKSASGQKTAIKDFDVLLSDMEQVKKGLNLLINKEVDGKNLAQDVNIKNFPPQMIPTPVTHISINALQGFVKTSATTVGTSLTKLPNYGQLMNRRALLIYNNSANTIYVGGSDVTSVNGLPVPASAFSPILDLGYNTIVYGIASTSNNNVRIIEVSDEASGR